MAEGPISKDQMKEEMIKAQKEAYQDGLDHNILHPYMWLNKGHYYSSGLSFIISHMPLDYYLVKGYMQSI